ncbi:hypothetical protein [uncultured Winogradskyella sp.]|uniref:hypothetical protein n=1 Tax=uncultured Winogradskyella sp. TaxID=395353 RepID=UPI002602AF2D|nr:hypothetical protein [uncultured Winogradskyella sp.]
MKKTIIIAFALVLGFSTYGQVRRDRMGNPVTPSEPSEKEIAKRKQMIEERRKEYIANFLTTLEADEFQKEIIKQSLDSFYEAKIGILKTRYEHSIDRKDAIKKLVDTHFVELEELISENDMIKIKDLATGKFDESEVKKKNKKKKKRKKKNKDKG